MPADMIAGMRQSPLWPTLQATAHTLVYDSLITGSMPPERLAAISTPTLVTGSQASTDQLRTRVQGVAQALPDASARFPPGTWHGVPAEHLAPALTEFFTARQALRERPREQHQPETPQNAGAIITLRDWRPE